MMSSGLDGIQSIWSSTLTPLWDKRFAVVCVENICT